MAHGCWASDAIRSLAEQSAGVPDSLLLTTAVFGTVGWDDLEQEKQ